MSKQRTLSEHAAYELTKAGMTNNDDPRARKVAIDVMALVRRFEKQDHDDKTGPFVLEAFETLCTRLPLTPITDDPEEWDKFETERKNIDTGETEKRVIWQSRRAPSIFSEDEGKTFTDQRTGKVGTSVDHVKQAAERKAAEEDRAKRKADAAKRAEGKVETPAGEASLETPAQPKSKSQQRREAAMKEEKTDEQAQPESPKETDPPAKTEDSPKAA